MIIKHLKPALAAGIAAATALTIATPATAQVSGIATADAAVAIAGTQALQTAYQQIQTTYATQRTQLETLNQQRDGLVRTFDTNGNGQIDDAEAAATNDPNNATVQQIQSLDQQIATAQAPIQRARAYVVSQLAEQYMAAARQVISEKGVQIMISPEALVYAPEQADVTQAISTALNTLVPTVSITAPENWQPGQTVVQLFQEVNQVILRAALAQQQQQQAAAAANGSAPVEGR